MRKDGVFVDLDYPHPSDPLLLGCVPESWRYEVFTQISAPFCERSKISTTPFSQTVCYNFELRFLIFHLYLNALETFAATPRGLRDPTNAEKLLWETPGPFRSSIEPLVDTWVRPLWRLFSDEVFLESRRERVPDSVPMLHGRVSYANVMAIIEKDVGPSELVFRAALRVPLPPPKADELSLKPAFQCLLHIGTIPELMHAVVDIAKGITQFPDPSLCFPALTPDRMLFQTQHLTTDGPLGFILDLDRPDEPSSHTECAGEHYFNPRARRFAAYDLATTTIPLRHNPIFYARHPLESLFYALCWFFVANEFRSSPAGMVPIPHHLYDNMFFNMTHSNISPNRTYEFDFFIQQRRAFLRDWVVAFRELRQRSNDDITAAVDACLAPLWRLIGEAHWFSRDREDELGYDWETLGGMFTMENFMKILETGSARWVPGGN
ncbi:hypothetical protein B0H11DRAFT_2104494 [Mycena galericulata]|nr:hypothetical protein B0H11DRAFT_2104494 [Mycena galericulata]